MSLRNILVVVLVAGAAVGGFFFWQGHRKATLRTVVFLSVDTLRPERTGLYGGAPGVSPIIDALGPQSAVFDQALANSPYTLPSHMSMLTGLDPVAHGVKREGCLLSSRVLTLAESLKDNGFECGAFTDGGYVSARYGFSQGFHVFDDKRDERPDAVNGMSRIAPLALDWLDKHAEEDVFLFVHTFDVHAPYQEGDPEVLERFRKRPVRDGELDRELHRLTYMYQQQGQRISEYGRMAELLNDYDAGINEADRGLGRIVSWLKAHGRFDNALIVVTSDHGESFADHGIHVGHGISLTDDEVHIPLLLKLPQAEGAGTRLDAPVSLVDLAPTVLDVFGLPPGPEMQGESLLGLLHGQPRKHDFVFGYSPNTESIYLMRKGWKYISPPSIPPMIVAQRHLGPTLPPDGGPEPPDAEDYDFGPKDKAVKLRYASKTDPLAIRDVILTGNRLYDRAADPRELHDVWEENKDGVGRELSGFALSVLQSSIALNKSLDDGTQQSTVGQSHVDTTLAALGYAGAVDQATQQAFLNAMPQDARDELKHPFHGPDTTDLVEADKITQIVRMAQRDGRELNADVGRRLKRIGESLQEWAVAHVTYRYRVGWRLNELIQLAEQAHAPMDAFRLGEFHAWLKNQAEAERVAAESKATGETPAKSPGQGGDPPK
jgi:arylsulfatase A-like enzyme